MSDFPATEDLAARLETFVPTLPRVEQQVSLGLIRLLSRGRPVSFNLLSQELDLPRADVEGIVSSWTGVNRDANGNIRGYWGFDLKPTPHELEVDGIRLYAWGAWDALFLSELIGRSVSVRSTCPETERCVRVQVRPNGISRADPKAVLSFLFPARGKALHETDADNYCRFVHFFSSALAGQAWCARNPGTFVVSLDQGFHLGHVKNRKRYADELGSML